MTDDAIQQLRAELLSLLGPRGVGTTDAELDRASADGSHLSPIINAQLPLGRAELVAYPPTAELIADTVAAAVRHGVPITPRGKGTGNYGQAIPLHGGLVLDMSRAKTIHEVGDGFVTADAGATLISLEQAANEAGQQVLMYPSTAGSSIGGFLSGGSGGTGSIKHGLLHTGYALSLQVVHAVPHAHLQTVTGPDAELYLHNYGTAGIIARATIALEPLQPWCGFFASFPQFSQALSVIRPFAALRPTPRLVSADVPVLANALPANRGIPADRASLRAILDADSVPAATELVEAAGGRVEAVADDANTCVRISMMSYNHPVEWIQRAHPGRYFHVEVAGDALIDRIAEVNQVYPGAMLHIEAQRERPIGMLVAEYESANAVYAGFQRLTDLGVGFHNPHQWYVDYQPERTRLLAARTDPQQLLNPGKLVEPAIATGRQT